MAFCTPQELVAASATHRAAAIQEYTVTPQSYAYPAFSRVYGPITLERAKAIVEGVKVWTKARRQAKINRPYEIVDVTANLDPEQAWVAWEIECGWADQQNYDRVIDYIWRYHNHVTVDIEGAGRMPTEITFCPENADKMFSGKAQVHRFLNWVQSRDIRSASWNESSQVGTHLNVSTPAYRSLPSNMQGAATNVLNAILRTIDTTGCRELFGRGRPYGYAFRHLSGRRSWIELKLFNSTINPSEFAGYCKTAKNMVRLIDLICTNPTLEPRDNVIHINESNETPEMRELREEYLRTYSWMTLGRHHIVCLNALQFLRGEADKLVYGWQFSPVYKRLAIVRGAELANNNEQE